MADEGIDATERADALRTGRPGAHRLACVLSLAARIELSLLRRARLMLPDLDASAEADLWTSDVIASRTPEGLVFDAGVADVLRRELARDPPLLTASWDLIAWEHRDAPWPIRAEERIGRLSLSDTRADLDEAENILLAAARSMVESSDPVAAARWVVRMLSRLPPTIGSSPTARTIQAGVGAHLDGSINVDRNELTADAMDNWFPWLMPQGGPRVEVAVSLLDGYVRVGGGEPGSEPGATPPAIAGTIRLPRTTPLLLDLSWHDGLAPHVERITFEASQSRLIRVTAQDIELRGLDGTRYRLSAAQNRPRATGGGTGAGIDFGSVRARHRPFLGRETELKDLDALRGEQSIVAITGASGLGKTALLCRYLDRLEERGERILVHFLEGGPAAWRVPHVVLASLRAQMAPWRPEGIAPQPSLVHVLSMLPPDQPVSLLLDGPDVLSPDDPAARWLVDAFDHDLPRNLTVLLATTRLESPLNRRASELDLSVRTDSNADVCARYLEMHRELVVRLTSVTPVRTPKAFLISAHSDAQGLQQQIARTLQRAGIELWLDKQEIRAGDYWREAIERALADADFAVLVASVAAARSEYVHYELALLSQSGKPILPVTANTTEVFPDGAFDVLRGTPILVVSEADDWPVQLLRSIRLALGWWRDPALVLLDRCNGNIGRLVAMIDWIRAQPGEQVFVERIPPVLYGGFDAVWTQVAADALNVDLLGLLAAAREPIPDWFLSALFEASGREIPPLEAVGLVVSRKPEVPPANRPEVFDVSLPDEATRAAIVERIGRQTMQSRHSNLADSTSPSGYDDPDIQAYALRHRLAHLVDAGRDDDAAAVATDTAFLSQVCATLGVDNLEAQLAYLVEQYTALTDHGHAAAKAPRT